MECIYKQFGKTRPSVECRCLIRCTEEVFPCQKRLKPYGIQVTVVELGDIHTGFTQARQKVIVGDKEYGGRISRSVSQMEKDEQNGANPEVIGAYIAKIAEKKCKPICVAGAQYKFLSLLCKLLPCGIRGKIVGAIYAK